ncbi:MAG TPA: alkaline shock response membrane anchor protein AmaP [Thermomonospora sp.]|nr:alkaline shock response membrane anchor protein AmaP [Thermomonospora sp.]
MNRRAAGINRFGLTLLGLLLLAGGGLALARSLGAFGDGPARDPLLTDRLRALPGDNGWLWPAVAAGAVVLALLGLAWLLAQGRSERLADLSLERNRAEGDTRVSSDAVTSAIEHEIDSFPGVERTRARLLGTREHPRLVLNVAYGARADLGALRRFVANSAVARLREALDRDSLPTVVRLRMVDSEGRRTLA